MTWMWTLTPRTGWTFCLRAVRTTRRGVLMCGQSPIPNRLARSASQARRSSRPSETQAAAAAHDRRTPAAVRIDRSSPTSNCPRTSSSRKANTRRLGWALPTNRGWTGWNLMLTHGAVNPESHVRPQRSLGASERNPLVAPSRTLCVPQRRRSIPATRDCDPKTGFGVANHPRSEDPRRLASARPGLPAPPRRCPPICNPFNL